MSFDEEYINEEDYFEGLSKYLKSEGIMEQSKKVTLSGRDPEVNNPSLGAPAPIDPNTGMYKDYWILSDEERAKGFIRPVRTKYVHKTCGVETVMHIKFAETYSRDPKFYGSTFCVGSNCRTHYPVSEFYWSNDPDQDVGS